MSPSVRLGLRLAVGTSGQRLRSALVVVATAVGSWLLLSTFAVGRAIAVTDNGDSSADRDRLALSIVAAVALPILVLATSVGRLSASVRDRRLANLRLLGLMASQTRTVAATEAGVAAVVGTLLGAVAYIATRPALAHLSFAGHRWSAGALDSSVVGWIIVAGGLPALVCCSAIAPVRGGAASALTRARRASDRRPSPWWAVPLVVGIVLCAIQLVLPREENLSSGRFVLFFAGAIGAGLGVVLVAAWVVRGLADVLVQRARGPVTGIAGRRLQSQPGGVVRVTSALVIGLFLVTGARAVLVAFEDQSQYAAADAAVHSAQRVAFDVSATKAETVTSRAAALTGVTDVITVPRLEGSAHGPSGRTGATVLVATCAQLTRIQPELRGCVDAPMSTGNGLPVRGELTIKSHGSTLARFAVPQHRLTSPTSGSWPGALSPVEADFVVPPDTPGIQDAVLHANRMGLVVGAPGRDLPDRLAAAGVPFAVSPDYGYYDFVAGLRAILWTVAAVVLCVGLLTLGIGAADRAMARRRELAALRVLGTPPSVLRRAQLLEAAIPTVAATLLAVATGFLAGATYLRMVGIRHGMHLPWTSTLEFALVSVAAALVVAWVTVLATNVRLSPDVIRQE